MRVVIQRVSKAAVLIKEKIKGEISIGLLIFVGIENADNFEDIEWLAGKISRLRIFDDENGVMNLSVKDVEGEILLISQFTLHANSNKGNRPSYNRASKPDIAIPLYERFKKQLEIEIGKTIQTGEFGAEMQVSLINDGPVTIIIDTKNRE